MKFLIDAQLPPALARYLQAFGHDAEHVVDVGLREADDNAIWQFATSPAAVLLTKDEDFAQRRLLTADGPAVIWLRVGNCTNRALLQWFAPMLPDIIERLQQGEMLIEVV